MINFLLGALGIYTTSISYFPGFYSYQYLTHAGIFLS